MIKLTQYFIKNHRITNMTVLLIFIIGIFSAITLNREQFPPFSFDVVKITTRYPGAAPEDVEINVTNKLETKLLEVENIRKLTSMSMENLSIILAEVDSDAGDSDTVISDIRNAVMGANDLPDEVTELPAIEEMRSSSIPVVELAVRGDIPEKDLRLYTRELESVLKEIPGISGITKTGYRKREIHIELDTAKMEETGISFREVTRAIASRNIRSSGGTLDSYVSEKNIVTLAEYDDPMDVKKVIVRSNFEGYGIILRDIADAVYGFEDPEILYRVNSQNAIGLMVSKKSKADIIDVSEKVRRAVEEFDNNLPEGVTASAVFDHSIYTRTMFDIVLINGLAGFALVLLVMFFFLDRKSAFWSAFGIPFSILGGIALFGPAGITLNTVSLGTIILVLGIVVDDAIVVTEKIFSLKQQGLSSFDAAIGGVKAMTLPVSAAVVTTILAFVPIVFIPGSMGRMVMTIPLVVMLILSISLIEALIFIPAHVAHGEITKKKSLRMEWINRIIVRYRKLILIALKNRKKVLTGFMIFLFISFSISIPCLKFILDEDVDQDIIGIVVETPKGTSMERTAAAVPAIEDIVKKTVPESILKSYSAEIGHHNIFLYSPGGGRFSNWALVKVNLHPASERDIKAEEVMTKLRNNLKKLASGKTYNRLEVLFIGGMESGKAIHVMYISDNNKIRKKIEDETIAFLSSIDGVQMIESSDIHGKDELQLKLNYPKCAAAGITALDIAGTVQTAFNGTIVTSIRKNGEDIDFRVSIKDSKKYKTRGILELPVANSEGKLVRLKHIARFKEAKGPAVINHYNGKRAVAITANVDTDKITPIEINRMVREKFGPAAAALPGLRMKQLGQEEEMAVTMAGFKFALIVVIISVYFILVILFNSYKQPLLIMSIIPFAVAGVFLTLLIHGRPLITITLVGLLGLIGIVVNDTIVMISNLNRECSEKGVSFNSIADGAAGRFRPVILTTLTTFVGLIPTAYGIGGDLPAIRPLVLSMAWGLLFSTAVTLVFTPLLYSYMKIGKENRTG